VRQYIELSWDRTDDGDLIRPETDSGVAEKLGVDRSLVSRVIKNVNAHIIYHDRVKASQHPPRTAGRCDEIAESQTFAEQGVTTPAEDPGPLGSYRHARARNYTGLKRSSIGS